MAVLLAQLVRHVQQDQGWNAQCDDARCQDQMRVQVGRVQDEDDGVGCGRARHLAGKHIDRYLLIFGFRGETIDTGQVDERNFFPVGVADVAGVMLDGDAGKVANLLAQLGEAIEEGGLAGIGRPDNGYRAIGAAD